MESTFAGIELGKRGLIAHQAALHVTGHNVSNAETEGYSRQRVTLEVFDPLYNYFFNETTQEIIHNYNITERRALFNTTYDNVENKDNWSRNRYIKLADYFCCFYLIIENPGIFKPLYPTRSLIYNDGQNSELPIFTDIDWYE